MIESEGVQKIVRREVRSPRSAALAGILFSLLMATSMILLRTGAIVDPDEIGSDWLEVRLAEASVILVLIPFAGIAFLWFTGVMRDLLGDLEDKFFATVFLGSGIILVFAGALRWARFIFPAWVLLVSVYILILNYRYNRGHERDEELTLEA